MTEKLLRATSYAFILFAVSVATGQTAPKGPPALPGITAKDLYPRACVDCHVSYLEQKMDLRFSALLKQWTEKVDPQLLKREAASAPPGLTLKGKHPAVSAALKNIPKACLPCHGAASKTAPPFSRMMHVIHFTGGKENRFLTVFQGGCTHCHKFNTATGTWSLPSGPEKL